MTTSPLLREVPRESLAHARASRVPATMRMVGALSIATAAQVAVLILLSTDPWRAGLRTPSELASVTAHVALGLLGVSTVGVVWLGRAQAVRDGWRETLGDLGRWPFALLAVNALLSVALVRPIAGYPLHLVIVLTSTIVAVLALLVAAADAPDRITHGLMTWIATSDRVRWIAALTALLVAVLLAAMVFHRIPHIPDEVVYLFQAKMLATGQISVAEPPGGRAWDVIHTMRENGRWFGIFPPGWPAVLAIGVTAGTPWLVNPVLAAVVVLAVHSLTRRAAGNTVANWTGLLLATSPWFLFLGASMMSHTVSLLFAAVVLDWALRPSGKGRRDGQRELSVLRAAISGLALGALVLTRPIEGVALGLTIGVWLLVVSPRAAFSARGLTFGAAALALGSLMLPYNAALTGGALRDPITAYFDTHFYAGANRLGFGATVGNLGWGNDVLPGHSPLEAAINANLNSHLVQLELFGWGVGSLLVVFAYIGSRKRTMDRVDALMVAWCTMILFAYAIYWYSGADFGPRYWSQLLIPLAVLTARGINALGAKETGRDVRSSRSRATWATALLFASALGAPLVVVTRAIGKYRDYRGMTPAVANLAEHNRFGNALVLLRGDVFSDYAAGMMLNDVSPVAGRPVYARYVDGVELADLRRAFPERSVWVVDGPSITGAAPRVTRLPGGVP